jgi:hypothetical protein
VGVGPLELADLRGPRRDPGGALLGRLLVGEHLEVGVDRDAAAVLRDLEGRQRVVRPHRLVAEDDRRVLTQEERAVVGELLDDRAGLVDHHLEVLDRVVVDDLDRVGHRLRDDGLAVVLPALLGDVGRADLREPVVEGLDRRLRDLPIRRDEDRPGVGVVFGLREQVRRDESGVGRLVREDQHLRRPREEVEKKTQGISLFLVDIAKGIDDNSIQLEEIEKTVSSVVSSFRVTYDDLQIPVENLIGEEDRGFYHVLDGLNEERLVIAAECIGLGELAVEKGVNYANDREVFGRPIGQNQGIQHPLAAAFARLQAAKQIAYDAAGRTDEDRKTVGARANMAKYLAAEAAFEAADAAVQAHGGRGVAREYDVERYFREARLTRLVPITQELVLNYLGENILGLPRSY